MKFSKHVIRSYITRKFLFALSMIDTADVLSHVSAELLGRKELSSFQRMKIINLQTFECLTASFTSIQSTLNFEVDHYESN